MKRIELKPDDHFDQYEKDDAKILQEGLRTLGYDASIETIIHLWRKYSDDMWCAGWMGTDEDSATELLRYAEQGKLIYVIDA